MNFIPYSFAWYLKEIEDSLKEDGIELDRKIPSRDQDILFSVARKVADMVHESRK